MSSLEGRNFLPQSDKTADQIRRYGKELRVYNLLDNLFSERDFSVENLQKYIAFYNFSEMLDCQMKIKYIKENGPYDLSRYPHLSENFFEDRLCLIESSHYALYNDEYPKYVLSFGVISGAYQQLVSISHEEEDLPANFKIDDACGVAKNCLLAYREYLFSDLAHFGLGESIDVFEDRLNRLQR